ncbi:MAG: hypothetical protein V3T07_07120 [Myxococcota bacterium]
MRSDMHKVLVERPRVQGWNYLRHHWWWRGRPVREDDPLREPMSRGRGTKVQSENFAPMLRFLRSRVGRPWNDVFSEICAGLRGDSTVKKHVHDHLLYTFVELDVRLVDGKPEISRVWSRFYVCPKTGALRETPRGRNASRPKADPTIRVASETREYHQLDGQWYEIELAPVPRDPCALAAARDAVLRRPLAELVRCSGEVLRERYGTPDRYAVRKRQISKREIRDLAKNARARLPPAT